MALFKKKNPAGEKFFPVPKVTDFVPRVIANTDREYSYNIKWLKHEEMMDTSPIGSTMMALMVMTEPRYCAYIDKMVEGVEKVVAEKMKLKETKDFVATLARSAEIGGALAFLEVKDHVTPVGKMHPSVWNAIVSQTFENEENTETKIQTQARFCAAIIGYSLVWEDYPTAEAAARAIKPVKY